ncbi:MAG: NAD-dependent epimerase/dehydratase family protein [Nitrososphaera sp.]
MKKLDSEHVIITGGAGFIGSHLAESLAGKLKVTIIDNMSTGNRKNLSKILQNKSVSLRTIDVYKLSTKYLENCDVVFHLAGRSDVRESMINPKLYFNDNVNVTANLLESMRKADVQKIIFTSSSVVYGNFTNMQKEDAKTKPISIYGATKLICESIIESYCTMYGFKGVILRFANIVGSRSPKGIIRDLVQKFQHDPKRITVLGDGKQTKSYLHVDDCVKAILTCYKNIYKQNSPISVYNIANKDYTKVKDIVDIIADEMNLRNYKILYFKHNNAGAGWAGDITVSRLDISKIRKLSWTPRLGSDDAIRQTVKELLNSKNIV